MQKIEKSTCIFKKSMLYCSSTAREQMYAAIAQLDRVTDYESVGRGFESLSAYQKYQIPSQVSGIFIFVERDSNISAYRFFAVEILTCV